MDTQTTALPGSHHVSPRARLPSPPFRTVNAPPAAVRPPPSPPYSVYQSLSIVPVGALTAPGGHGLPASGLPAPRDAEHTVLHQVIAEHLEAFLGAVAEAGDGAGLPQFVEREFREFLPCGVFEAGVARFRCEGCAREHLVPFSCKGRGWCPSCGGRRMTERAAHLVDAVLPWVPVRQWVLTVPYRLRYQMAWNHGLSRAVLRVYTRVLLDVYRRGARARGIAGGQTGMVTAMQRAGGGVERERAFSHPRAGRGVHRSARGRAGVSSGAGAERRRGRGGAGDDPPPGATAAGAPRPGARPTTRRGRRIGSRTSPPCWRGSSGASVQGRVALGPRAGARVRRLGDARDTATVTSRGPRQAHLEGFDLHANVWVSANDRAGLERLCRYILRPPFAQERLRLRSDGRIALELKTAWHDGTRELVFEPLELLERSGGDDAAAGNEPADLPWPVGRACPLARARGRVRTRGARAHGLDGAAGRRSGGHGGEDRSPRAWSWAALMHRAFAIDVLACPHCGGRLRLIATLHDPAVIRKILAHLGIGPSGQSPGPAPPESGAAAS